MKNLQHRIIAAVLLVAGLLAGTSAFAQQKTVTGRVVDEKGVSVISAAVVNEATRDGVITDYDGRFSIKAAPGQTLRVELMGYQTREVKVGPEDNITVVLVEDSEMLEDVVVVGYAVQKKVNV